jgi:hypothetical protein
MVSPVEYENRFNQTHKPPDPVSAKRGQAQSIPAPPSRRCAPWNGYWRENLIVCGPAGHCKTFLPGLHVDWFSLESLGVLVRRHRVDDPGFCVRIWSWSWSTTSGCWPWAPTPP